ncbi:hypothetical protein Cfor_09718 [Coptotermes formosanus]|uniref:N-acetyltransferase domain-containing protein n=1 Tax=Coptotermes formosanus TaxID=36987 RepID=A0A6L2Q4S2_COPFO|nr:hypothetical protein Cfor_09718 [Coptotermes formosanus]
MADMKFRKIFDLLYGVNRSLDLFTQHGVDRIFECRILSVDKRFRGRGLARELLRRSEITARECGFKVVVFSLSQDHLTENIFLKFIMQTRKLCYSENRNYPSYDSLTYEYPCLRKTRQGSSLSAWQRAWGSRRFIRSATPITHPRRLEKSSSKCLRLTTPSRSWSKFSSDRHVDVLCKQYNRRSRRLLVRLFPAQKPYSQHTTSDMTPLVFVTSHSCCLPVTVL